jgi:hypothetical protein
MSKKSTNIWSQKSWIDKLKERLDAIEEECQETIREETDYQIQVRFAKLKEAKAKKTKAHVIKPVKMSGMALCKKN